MVNTRGNNKYNGRYLVAYYDSYHNMHQPGNILWETGGIMRKDGQYRDEFKD